MSQDDQNFEEPRAIEKESESQENTEERAESAPDTEPLIGFILDQTPLGGSLS